MTGDNGAGLRALFYGLCLHWNVRVIEEDGPADFYLPGSGGVYVVIIPEPADRQVEIAALQGHCLIILDSKDIDAFRQLNHARDVLGRIDTWVRYDTHGAAMRRSIGLPSVAGS